MLLDLEDFMFQSKMNMNWNCMPLTNYNAVIMSEATEVLHDAGHIGYVIYGADGYHRLCIWPRWDKRRKFYLEISELIDMKDRANPINGKSYIINVHAPAGYYGLYQVATATVFKTEWKEKLVELFDLIKEEYYGKPKRETKFINFNRR